MVTAVKNTVIYDVIADNAPVYILHLTVTVTLLLLGLIAALADAPYCYRRSSVVCHDRHPKNGSPKRDAFVFGSLLCESKQESCYHREVLNRSTFQGTLVAPSSSRTAASPVFLEHFLIASRCRARVQRVQYNRLSVERKSTCSVLTWFAERILLKTSRMRASCSSKLMPNIIPSLR